MAAQVLIVDDNRNIREFCARMLVREGYTVVQAANGDQAIVQLHTEKPQVVILDVRLPRVSGLDLVEQISTRAPVILYSAHAESFDDPRARWARACIEKTENLSALLATVRRIVAETPTAELPAGD